MKIEKLELKHLCGYLPYGLKWTLQELNTFTMSGITKETLYTEDGTVLTWPKHPDLPTCLFPLLLPLSALTEQLEDGTVPIVELAKIVWDKNKLPDNFLYQSLTNNTVFVAFSDKKNVFGYDSNTNSFFGAIDGKSCSVVNQLQLFEYLFSKHFDIFDLIGNNLALDKRQYGK